MTNIISQTYKRLTISIPWNLWEKIQLDTSQPASHYITSLIKNDKLLDQDDNKDPIQAFFAQAQKNTKKVSTKKILETIHKGRSRHV